MPQSCAEFETSLFTLNFSNNGNSISRIYQVAICITSIYGDLCTTGTTDQIAKFICNRNGYTCKLDTDLQYIFH